MEGKKICLVPTTCHILEFPGHLGQAVKAAHLCKEEVATRLLTTIVVPSSFRGFHKREELEQKVNRGILEF